ncbi:hypothetical protein [Francisella adeliensis]|uniref:hypothetical protein n=1 Tax=Francisella adeliensis TaxID=2007306 RepID=UPI0013AEBF0C|nr:hypothetical protein [Francisella adeliensis]MBK2086464.1 hypothetical protein [Francisella adeliensis]MBK2096092.1 hypothetical protein [Francisella adeliensis]
MQQAVFLFTQIFFVVLAISVIGITIFTIVKKRDKSNLGNDKMTSSASNKIPKNESR